MVSSGHTPGNVNITDVLNPQEVFAVGSVLGDGELNEILIPGAPGIRGKVL